MIFEGNLIFFKDLLFYRIKLISINLFFQHFISKVISIVSFINSFLLVDLFQLNLIFITSLPLLLYFKFILTIILYYFKILVLFHLFIYIFSNFLSEKIFFYFLYFPDILSVDEAAA